MSQNVVSSTKTKSVFFKYSLTNIRVLTFCGMMCALAVILSFVATIKFGPYVRVGFSGIPNQVVDYLFGPFVGAIFAAVLDIVKWLVNGDGDFFIGFTISAVVAALIYGFILFNKPVNIVRVFVSQLITKIVVNLFLNTLWMNILYGKAIAVILPGRIISNAVMLPIDTIIVFMILEVVQQSIKPYFANLDRKHDKG